MDIIKKHYEQKSRTWLTKFLVAARMQEFCTWVFSDVMLSYGYQEVLRAFLFCFSMLVHSFSSTFHFQMSCLPTFSAHLWPCTFELGFLNFAACWSLRKKAMEVCVKQGEIVNKHLKVEMNVGDVLCYGLDEKLIGCLFAIRGLWTFSCFMIFCCLVFFFWDEKTERSQTCWD